MPTSRDSDSSHIASGSASASSSSFTQKRTPRLSLPASIWNRRKPPTTQDVFGQEKLISPRSQDDSPNAAHGQHLQAQDRQPRRRTRSGFSALLSPRVGASKEEELDPLLTARYPDPEAVSAFAAALEEDQGKQEPPSSNNGTTKGSSASAWAKLGLPGLKSPPPLQSSPPTSEETSPAEQPTQTVPVTNSSRKKVGKIAAVSDFAPVRERTTSRRGAKSAGDTGRREGLIYSILRWPLLVVIFITIGLEFFAYVLTRQIVNVVEWAIAHRGKKGVLRRKMRKAQTFDEWRETALELDDFMEHEKWKVEDASGLYDWILIKKVLHSLKTFREQEDTHELMAVLDLCCRNNFAGTENFRLYSETYYGTKYLIEAYLAEVELGLDFITKTDKVPWEHKRAFFRGVSKNLGRSGLCLSGGGAFGYYHVGLVKALLDANLLPKIVSGTSAGGLIAALTCTRTDEELSRLLVPELADRITACEEPLRIWAARAWKTGARFDPLLWAEKAAFFTGGSLTFKEAYERTGKTLNVSVIPSDKHSPTKLLNHLTAPRCVIWSALLASAAVPGLLPPVCLMQKTRKGEFVPWNWGHRFKDGSLRVDIPLQDLHSMFHVNYPIVSQVNPHVHLFFFAPKGMPGRPVAHRKGKGWRGGFILSASEHVLKLHLSLNFKIIRDLDLLPAILGTDWSGVFLQRFEGAVTIWPKTRFWDWIRILSDPDRGELARMMKVAQAATFPKLHMIENRIRIERAVETGRRACRQAIRKQLKANSSNHAAAGGDSAVQTPNSAAIDTPGQDSGTDASINGSHGNRFRAMYSDTDGEVNAKQGGTRGEPSDYFRAKPGSSSRSRLRPQGTNHHPSSEEAVSARRRFGNAMGISKLSSAFQDNNATDQDSDYYNKRDPDTPGSEIGTPGELPRPSRARSHNMLDSGEGHDLSHGRGDLNRFKEETLLRLKGHRLNRVANYEDDEEDEMERTVTNNSQDYSPLHDNDNTPRKALTAADLTPQINRFSSGPRRNSRQSSHNTYNSSHEHSNNNVLDDRGHGHGHGHGHIRDWSANRGSIGPESPWDKERDQEESDDDESSSDTESDD
ncbi:unnamed protein product [Sympodiomycopsis kandeliae]